MAKKLYVGNLNYNTTEAQVRELFAQAGEVVSVAIIMDETGRSKGFGFVEMQTDEAASEAIKRFNNLTLDRRNIVVNEARPREDRGGGGGYRGGGGGYGGGGRDRGSGGGYGGGGNRGGGYNDRDRY